MDFKDWIELTEVASMPEPDGDHLHGDPVTDPESKWRVIPKPEPAEPEQVPEMSDKENKFVTEYTRLMRLIRFSKEEGVAFGKTLVGYPATLVDFMISFLNSLYQFIRGGKKKEAVAELKKEAGNVVKLIPNSFASGLAAKVLPILAATMLAPFLVVILALGLVVISYVYYVYIRWANRNLDNEDPKVAEHARRVMSLVPDRMKSNFQGHDGKNEWLILGESSINDLYDKAVAAFPKTTMRQHATHPILIEKIDWTPFLGMNTLFVKGQARNEDRHYTPMILFKGMNYGTGEVNLTASDGQKVSFDKISAESTDALVRCNCDDFKWRFNYYNHLDKSLYGRKRAKYEAKFNPDSANPQKSSGMCKHIMKMMQALEHSNIFS